MRQPGVQERLNILMIAAQQTGGGAGRGGERLAQALRDEGHRVTSFVRDNPARDPHCRQVNFWRTRRLAAWLARRGFPELGHVETLLWRCHAAFAAADVLHLQNIHGEYLCLAGLPIWGFDKPIVWTLHDFWALSGNCATPCDCTRWMQSCGRCPRVGVYPMGAVDRSHVYRRLKPLLIRAARARLVTPSRWLAERAAAHPGLAGVPVRVIPYPIDTDIFAPCAERAGARREFALDVARPTVVMSGNSWLDPFKGGADAIRALRIAQQREPRLQLLIAGSGGERLLAAAGIAGRAVPFVTDRCVLARAYAAGDVCLFSSRAENYPLTILESLASGTPVAAYGVGGVAEQIAHGRWGYVAPDGDFERLAAGVIELARSPAHSVAAGARGREFVERTSHVDVVRAQYEDEYRRAQAAWSARRARSSARFRRGAASRRLARMLGWDAAPGPRAPAPGAARMPALARAPGGAP